MDRSMPDVPGVRHRFVDAGGLRVHVAEAGLPAGSPLVLLHGWPEHWLAWRLLIPPLGETHRLICPDLRGMGWTAAPAGAYEKEEMASDLLALIDALGLDRVDFVGHDWGGFVGLLAGIRAPERFRRLAALSIIHPWVRIRPSLSVLARLSYQFVLATPVVGPMTLRTPGLFRRLVRVGNGPEVIPDDVLDSYAARLAEPARAKATSALYRTLQLLEAPAIARGRYASLRLTVPTLMMLGTADPVLQPAWLDGAERHADEFRLELIEGAGHFLPEERPTEVLGHLRTFLA